MQMPAEVTVGVLQKKKVFFKILQNSQKTSVAEEILVNFEKVSRMPFLQNNSGRLLLKSDIAITGRER